MISKKHKFYRNMKLSGENQSHGKLFEIYIRDLFLNGKDDGSKPLDAFDIKACKETCGVPVSIKMTKSETICLADAQRAFSIDHSFKMIVGAYRQEGDEKCVWQIYEFNITADEWSILKGNLDLELIANFNQKIKSYPIGKHSEGRKYSRDFKKKMNEKYNSFLKINPKIDSKNQRRLQCSITLSDLKSVVKNWTPYSRYNFGNYRGMRLPFNFISKRRQFHKKRMVA